jgi:small-conductance mechanosensitive channel
MVTWTQVVQHASAWFAEYLWRALGAFVVLVIGLLLAWVVSAILRRLMHRRVSNGFMSHRTMGQYFAVRAVTTLAILVTTAILVLVALGVAGPVIGFVVTLGLALGVFADSLGGFRILLFRPFEIGDLLELKGEGLKGVVEQITLSGIVLMTASNARVILNNRKLFENPIVNHTAAQADARLSFQLVLGLSADFGVMEETCRSIASGTPGFNSGHQCIVRVTRIEAEFVTFFVQFFVSGRSNEDPSALFLKKAKAEFDRLNIAVRLLEALES